VKDGAKLVNPVIDMSIILKWTFLQIDWYLTWILSRCLNYGVFIDTLKILEYPLGNYMLELYFLD
jgi:hypothetical protein